MCLVVCLQRFRNRSCLFAMSSDWLSGADECRVRSRRDLRVPGCRFLCSRLVAVDRYIAYDPKALDPPCRDVLRGSHELVIESFLLSHDGRHVSKWYSGDARHYTHSCSLAAQGLLTRLEDTRQLYPDIRFPRGLVPLLLSLWHLVCFSYL